MSEAIAFDPVDEQLIGPLPVGDRYTLLAISLGKRLLTAPWIKPGEQFRLLEKLHELVDGQVITTEMLETIEPMSDTALRILDEASGDDQDDKPVNPSFQRVTCGRGFRIFLSLDPSLLAAIRLGACRSGCRPPRKSATRDNGAAPAARGAAAVDH